MKKFKLYLHKQNYSDKTIKDYCHFISKYISYCNDRNINYNRVDYNTIVKYIRLLKRYNSHNSIISNLIALKHFYNSKNVKYNPIKFNIKRKTNTIPTILLTQEQLEQIYDNFKQSSIYQIRNKVAISLFIFQGIHSYELGNIKIQHVNLNNLTITVAGNHKSNNRVLPLHIKQVLLLNTYINQCRNKLLSNRKDYCDLLIVTSKNKNSFRSILNQLNSNLKDHTKVTLTYIRTSIIKNWLKQYDLRKVQYLAGHKYISSTERYITVDIDKLKSNIIKHHPF